MVSINDKENAELERHARAIRITIIEMLAAAKSGHLAGPLGMTDIFTALYFHVLKHDPKNPDWPERDRLFLSNGHICPVRYAAMAHSGYFPVEECMTLRKFGSRLQGHPERDMLPGVETTSGPLGSGISQAAGYAYAARMDKKDFRIFCATSDGEHEEGNTWEGIMFAGKYRLNHLTVIMDRNNIQIDGNTEDIMPLEPLADKYRAFNWHVIEVDGHNIRGFVAACDEARSIKEKPTMILAHTTPGKGVPVIEGDYRWHGAPPGKGPTDKVPAEKQKEVFLQELSASGKPNAGPAGPMVSRNASKGFTLIEILVVIAIIGILASVVLASLSGARSKARDARRLADLRSIQQALELYYIDRGAYPVPSPACSWSSWACWPTFIGASYISPTPVDPSNTDLGNCGTVPNCHIYKYCPLNGGGSYVLAVNLENPRPGSPGNNASCPTGGPNYYWVSIN